MAIPYDLATGTVVAIKPENPTATPLDDLHTGARVLAPIYNPRGYVKHWPATVRKTRNDARGSLLVEVAYDDGHRVGHYGRILGGLVYAVDVVELD
jgi:hypothetical protein